MTVDHIAHIFDPIAEVQKAVRVAPHRFQGHADQRNFAHGIAGFDFAPIAVTDVDIGDIRVQMDVAFRDRNDFR